MVQLKTGVLLGVACEVGGTKACPDRIQNQRLAEA